MAEVGHEGVGEFPTAHGTLVKWCFPASPKHPHGTPMTEKPDMSNMLKTFEDCLTRCGIIEDDRFICSESLDKGYADIMGIYFSVEEL